jgi:hypothetical protein
MDLGDHAEGFRFHNPRPMPSSPRPSTPFWPARIGNDPVGAENRDTASTSAIAVNGPTSRSP